MNGAALRRRERARARVMRKAKVVVVYSRYLLSVAVAVFNASLLLKLGL